MDFFGVVVEAWRIGESDVAPHFKVVAEPNAWSKRGKKGAPQAAGSGIQERQREFFQRLVDVMREEHQFTTLKKAGARSWVSFPSGVSGVGLGAAFGHGGMARVELYLNRDAEWNKSLFDTLAETQAEIHQELGKELKWERLDARKGCRVSVSRPGTSGDDDETLEDLRQWMADRLLAFRKVFRPRMHKIIQDGVP